jgi:hypothetical protein
MKSAIRDGLGGTDDTPSARNHHWNRIRAAAGLGNTTLYLATRHCFGYRDAFANAGQVRPLRAHEREIR